MHSVVIPGWQWGMYHDGVAWFSQQPLSHMEHQAPAPSVPIADPQLITEKYANYEIKSHGGMVNNQPQNTCIPSIAH